MQLGALGAAPAAAGVAWLAGDRPLAVRLLAGGTSAWALSKVVKRMVRRPRPAMLLPGTRRRGREAAGLGYLSGHAGVAVALGAAAFPRFGPGLLRPDPGCRPRRGPDPYLCRRPPSARRRRRRSAGTRHRRSNSPGQQSHRRASSWREAASTIESAKSFRPIPSSASVDGLREGPGRPWVVVAQTGDRTPVGPRAKAKPPSRLIAARGQSGRHDRLGPRPAASPRTHPSVNRARAADSPARTPTSHRSHHHVDLILTGYPRKAAPAGPASPPSSTSTSTNWA